MIIDTLEHFDKYVSIHPLFDSVREYLNTVQLANLPDGKHVVKGDDVFVNVQTVNGKSCEDAVFEYHRRMIDIQIPLNAEESYAYAPVETMPSATFNTDKDIAKVNVSHKETVVTCKPGMFVIFFPQDAHAPCISQATSLKKAVFKVKI